MPQYDGPYIVTQMAPDISTIMVDMPNNLNTFPTFHTSQALPFRENDRELFPMRELEQPELIMLEGETEYYVDQILDEHKCGRGTQYLVCWHGYGPEEDQWLPGHKVQECEVLDIWLAGKAKVAVGSFPLLADQ